MFLQNICENINKRHEHDALFFLSIESAARLTATDVKTNNDNNKFQLNFDIIQFEAEDMVSRSDGDFVDNVSHTIEKEEKKRDRHRCTVAAVAHNTPS